MASVVGYATAAATASQSTRQVTMPGSIPDGSVALVVSGQNSGTATATLSGLANSASEIGGSPIRQGTALSGYLWSVPVGSADSGATLTVTWTIGGRAISLGVVVLADVANLQVGTAFFDNVGSGNLPSVTDQSSFGVELMVARTLSTDGGPVLTFSAPFASGSNAESTVASTGTQGSVKVAATEATTAGRTFSSSPTATGVIGFAASFAASAGGATGSLAATGPSPTASIAGTSDAPATVMNIGQATAAATGSHSTRSVALPAGIPIGATAFVISGQNTGTGTAALSGVAGTPVEIGLVRDAPQFSAYLWSVPVGPADSSATLTVTWSIAGRAISLGVIVLSDIAWAQVGAALSSRFAAGSLTSTTPQGSYGIHMAVSRAADAASGPVFTFSDPFNTGSSAVSAIATTGVQGSVRIGAALSPTAGATYNTLPEASNVISWPISVAEPVSNSLIAVGPAHQATILGGGSGVTGSMAGTGPSHSVYARGTATVRSGSSMLVGYRVNRPPPDGGTEAQDWAWAQTYLGPGQCTKDYFPGGNPPANYNSPFPPGVLCIYSFAEDTNFDHANFIPHIQDLPPGTIVTFQHEPERPEFDWTAAEYVALFNAFRDRIRAIRTDLPVWMISSGYQYRNDNPGVGGAWFVGNKADGYGYDGYRAGTSGAVNYPAPMQERAEFNLWLSYVRPKKKPWGITETGFGWTTTSGPALIPNIDEIRINSLRSSHEWLRDNGCSMLLMFFSGEGPDGEDWFPHGLDYQAAFRDLARGTTGAVLGYAAETPNAATNTATITLPSVIYPGSTAFIASGQATGTGTASLSGTASGEVVLAGSPIRRGSALTGYLWRIPVGPADADAVVTVTWTTTARGTSLGAIVLNAVTTPQVTTPLSVAAAGGLMPDPPNQGSYVLELVLARSAGADVGPSIILDSPYAAGEGSRSEVATAGIQGSIRVGASVDSGAGVNVTTIQPAADNIIGFSLSVADADPAAYAAIAAIGPGRTTAISGLVLFAGGVWASGPRPTTAIAGQVRLTGTVAATGPARTTVFVGGVGTTLAGTALVTGPSRTAVLTGIVAAPLMAGELLAVGPVPLVLIDVYTDNTPEGGGVGEEPATWRYVAMRLDGLGGQSWLNLDLPLNDDVSITNAITGAGSLTASVPAVYVDEVAVDGRPVLEPWSTAIFAEADGMIRGGGILTELSWDREGETVSLTCMGFSGYAFDMTYTDDQYWVQVDPLDVFRHAWTHMQSKWRGNLGVTVDPTTSPVRIGTELEQVEFETNEGEQVSFEAGPYKMTWWKTDDIGGELVKLAESTPFDWRERVAWSGDHQSLDFHIELGYPRLGGRRHDLRFAVEENVTVQPSEANVGEDYSDEVTVVGAGDGKAAKHGWSARPTETRLRRAVTLVDRTLESDRAANASAAAELALRLGVPDVESIEVVDSDNAPIGSWQEGDDILVQLEEWSDWFRVTQTTITPASNRATLTLQRSSGVR